MVACNSTNRLTIKNKEKMFTVEQIEFAHNKVKSGADFPQFIQEIKQIGVKAFETWVYDSHTQYFGKDGYQTKAQPPYENLTIADSSNTEKFSHYLKIHQQGETDYPTFRKHCAETGIEKWVVCLDEMTCTYLDKAGNKILVEQIPQ
jgi:uncharacterized protein YbcV (DUF1398 family)